ncbi:hypothetical protein SGRA_3104 [Saprospira grandis str. Lewin]|uniref:Uncharacterized protein n=1 Tax=Saprospira grandis (strain Lewin) TaxID=984262 RepID=H6KZQ6_SAPGL|nr:hypothetical protein SGRA_3104 [Saprospira grandis str. Lewin]
MVFCPFLGWSGALFWSFLRLAGPKGRAGLRAATQPDPPAGRGSPKPLNQF